MSRGTSGWVFVAYQYLALAGVPGVTYIGNTGDTDSLELLTIELINGSSQIGGTLKLDKASKLLAVL